MKVEFVDLCGLRVDGRRPGELRKVHARMGVVSNATGSALLEQGLSKVFTPPIYRLSVGLTRCVWGVFAEGLPSSVSVYLVSHQSGEIVFCSAPKLTDSCQHFN